MRADIELFGGVVMSAAAGGSARLPPEYYFSPLAGLEAVSGGGPCPAEPARYPTRSRLRTDGLREDVDGTFRQCSERDSVSAFDAFRDERASGAL